ncbi:MAG: pilus assembly protein [Lachnospiraceae bacterium]|nr:pilus assembly protein [Lachnospiraceae bacterium]
MDIKTYWGVLYTGNRRTRKYKILQNIRIAPRHNLKYTHKNIAYKGHSFVFLFKKNGSITVEACFCVPIFFLALFSLFYIFQCLYRINYIQNTLADSAREYAVFGTKTGAVTAFVNEKVFINYDEDADIPICHVSYKIKIPFLSSQIFQLNFYQQMAINDFSGISMADNSIDNEKADYVYITKSGKVYHCDRKCTYLKPSVKEIQGKTVSSKRNSSGGKYKQCEKCCQDTEAENLSRVYITTYGDRYHKTPVCPKIKRDIRRVKKSEINNLPACSKCGTG